MFAKWNVSGAAAITVIVLPMRTLGQAPIEAVPSGEIEDVVVVPPAQKEETPTAATSGGNSDAINKASLPDAPAETAGATGSSPAATSAARGSSTEEGGFDTLAAALSRARKSRCATALCFGGSDGTKYAIEPLAEVPLGKTFVMPWVVGGLSDFVNNHDVSVTLAAGVRFWFAYDLLSLSVYLSSPLYEGDATIRMSGSPYEHSPSNLRRPFPGVGLGLLGDIVWLGADFNQLRNADSDVNRDLSFGRNQVISEVWTFTIGLSPIALARNGIGNVSRKD